MISYPSISASFYSLVSLFIVQWALGKELIIRTFGQEEKEFRKSVLRNFMNILEAQKTARKSQWSFELYIVLEIGNKDLKMMFPDMAGLLLHSLPYLSDERV